MQKPGHRIWAILVLLALLSGACQKGGVAARNAGSGTIVVTYSVLGALVKDLVGDAATVVVAMPNGKDPHEWEPSAQDIATLNRAALIVQNGLGLEGGMEKSLQQARAAGVHFFTASDHIRVRKVGLGEGIPTGDPDQALGADDPHLWLDPMAMQAGVLALAAQLKSDLGIDVTGRSQDLAQRLDALDREIAATIATIPEANRRLVTGHESMGYFAQRYGLRLVGAIVPSVSTQAEVSAADLAALTKVIQENHVKAVFAEVGTSPAVAQTIARTTGAQVIDLPTLVLPADGSYFTFMRELAGTIAEALKAG